MVKLLRVLAVVVIGGLLLVIWRGSSVDGVGVVATVVVVVRSCHDEYCSTVRFV